jgi:hypothetical protein
MRRQSGLQARRDAVIWVARRMVLLVCLLSAMPGNARASDDDLDAYKWRIGADWWYPQPSGSFNAAGSTGIGTFNLQQDFGFGNYSTFSGNADWRFTRKNHLTLDANLLDRSRSAILARDITFQGQTYDAGTQVSADLHVLALSPGYQYDITRRNHGFLAVAVQVDFFNTKASLTGTAVVNGQAATQTASGSIFAPLPVLGSHGRWYPLPHRGLLDFDGSVLGMYFFGYGNVISARGALEVQPLAHLKLVGGYQMGSRLRLRERSDQIGIRMTQKGVVAGIVAYW